MDPQEVARRCAEKMMQHDAASQHLGISLKSVSPGSASMCMKVTGNMLNGHGYCHGGFIFTLADSAFAFACNSYNQSTVASGAEITFLLPVQSGEHLTANAIEVHKKGRSGLYDVEVRNERAELVAVFRGHARTIKGTLTGLKGS